MGGSGVTLVMASCSLSLSWIMRCASSGDSSWFATTSRSCAVCTPKTGNATLRPTLMEGQGGGREIGLYLLQDLLELLLELLELLLPLGDLGGHGVTVALHLWIQ